MNSSPVSIEMIERGVAAVARATTPSEVFRSLVDASRVAAPRAAIFLLREGFWRGWGSVGYPEGVARRVRGTTLPAEGAWLGRWASGGEQELGHRSAAEAGPDFGQEPAAEAFGLPLRVGSRTVAVLFAERATGEEPWSPPALGLLVAVTRLRLELDLAWRRLRSAQPEAPAASPPVARPSPPPETGATEKPASPRAQDGGEVSLALWLQEPASRQAEPMHEQARRFARLVATEIRLYNEETVLLGRRHRDLGRRLGDQIVRGEQIFRRRFPDLGAAGAAILHDAFTQVLGGGDATLLAEPGAGSED